MPLVTMDFEFCVSACGTRIVPYQIGACTLESNLKFDRLMRMGEPVRKCVTAPEVDDAWLQSHGAVSPESAMQAFVAWLAHIPRAKFGVVLLAHNAFSADAFLLAELLRRVDLATPFCYVVDTLAYCRFAFRGDTMFFSQNALVQRYLHSAPQQHSAVDDASQLAALVRYARLRQPISGIAMPLGAVPVTCARLVGPATAALLLQHRVPVDVAAFAAYVCTHGWPTALAPESRASIAALVCASCTPATMLSTLAHSLSL
jgi:hypothetical protein